MPIFTPGRRWQLAYSPIKQQTFGNRLLEIIQKIRGLPGIRGPHLNTGGLGRNRAAHCHRSRVVGAIKQKRSTLVVR
jgi:hypothetical protein